MNVTIGLVLLCLAACGSSGKAVGTVETKELVEVVVVDIVIKKYKIIRSTTLYGGKIIKLVLSLNCQ